MSFGQFVVTLLIAAILLVSYGIAYIILGHILQDKSKKKTGNISVLIAVFLFVVSVIIIQFWGTHIKHR